MWVGGVADSQTRSKPLKSPRKSPFSTQISPFVFPNLTKTLGWVGKQIWERSPKKTFFWTPSLNAKVTHWLTEKTLAPTLPMWPWSLKIPDEDYWCDWQMVISYAYGDDGHGGWPGLSLRWLTCRLKRWLTWWWRYLMNGDTFGGDVRCGGHGCWEGGQNGEVSDGSWRVACGGVLNPIANCFVNPVNIWSIGHFSH